MIKTTKVSLVGLDLSSIDSLFLRVSQSIHVYFPAAHVTEGIGSERFHAIIEFGLFSYGTWPSRVFFERSREAVTSRSPQQTVSMIKVPVC